MTPSRCPPSAPLSPSSKPGPFCRSPWRGWIKPPLLIPLNGLPALSPATDPRCFDIPLARPRSFHGINRGNRSLAPSPWILSTAKIFLNKRNPFQLVEAPTHPQESRRCTLDANRRKTPVPIPPFFTLLFYSSIFCLARFDVGSQRFCLFRPSLFVWRTKLRSTRYLERRVVLGGESLAEERFLRRLLR